jgi:hypothetical protein
MLFPTFEFTALGFAISATITYAYSFHLNPTTKASVPQPRRDVSSGDSAMPTTAPSCTTTRRDWLSATTAAILTASSISNAAAALAADDSNNSDPLTSLYFGVGCFWHIQHEFIQAERNLLGRDDHQLTSRTGYAGGRSTDAQGRVCYHNFEGIADYGKLGHGEVVGMEIPESKIGDFGRVYFSLFNPKTKGMF